MLVTYNPEDGDSHTWEFNMNRVRQSEGEQIEKHYGGSYMEFVMGAMQQNTKALRVLLWYLMTRNGHPTMAYRDTPDFYFGEVSTRLTRVDIEALRRTVNNAPASKADKQSTLDGIDVMLAELAEDEQDPKAN